MRLLVLLLFIACGQPNRNNQITTPINLNNAIAAGDYQYIMNLGAEAKIKSTNNQISPLMDLFLSFDGLESKTEELSRLKAIESLLVKQMVDIDFRSKNDQSTCLSIAVLNNDIAGVKVLLKYEANLSFTYGPYKRTALHLAIDRNYREIIKLLYPVSDLTLTDKKGLTPLQMLQEKANDAVLNWIKEKNNLGSTQPADS